MKASELIKELTIAMNAVGDKEVTLSIHQYSDIYHPYKIDTIDWSIEDEECEIYISTN